MLYGVAAAGLVGLGAVVLVLVLTGGGGSSDPIPAVRQAIEGAGCTLVVKSAPLNEPDHSDVQSPSAKPKAWNTDPPTSGPHYGQTAVWGAYSEPLEQARVVHNLEHGGIALQYGDDVSPDTVAQLRAFYSDHQNGTILAPYPPLRNKISLGAWITEGSLGANGRGRGVLATCTKFDSGAFSTFFDELQFKGPERFDPSSLQPGQ